MAARDATPEDADRQIQHWLERQSPVTASLSMAGVPDAGALVTGIIVEADGHRAVEGDDGGFILIPPPSEADDIEIQHDDTGTMIVFGYSDLGLRLSDRGLILIPDA